VTVDDPNGKMEFLGRITGIKTKKTTPSPKDKEGKGPSPTLPPRPSPKVVEEMNLNAPTEAKKCKRPLSFADRFKKEQIPPTLPRPSPRTVRRITKSVPREDVVPKKKTTTSLSIKAIRPIRNFAIGFLNRLRRRSGSREDKEEHDDEHDDESLLKRSLSTLNKSPLVMNISIPTAPSRVQLEKDLTREVLNINNSKYEEHVAKGSPEVGFEVLKAYVIGIVKSLLNRSDDDDDDDDKKKIEKVVRKTLNSCCRTIHGAESYFAVASVLRTHYPEKNTDDDDDLDEEDAEDCKVMAIVSSVAIMPSKLKQPPNIDIQISSSDKKFLTVRVRSFNYFDVESENSRLRRVMTSDGDSPVDDDDDDDKNASSPTRSRSGSVDGMWVVDSKIEDLCTYDMASPLSSVGDVRCFESSRILTLRSEFLHSGNRS